MSDIANSPALNDRLANVRRRFIELLDERLDELEVLRDAMEKSEARDSAMNDSRFIVHKIAGTAGTLGFGEIGRLASDAESRIDAYFDSRGAAPTWRIVAEKIDQFLEMGSKLTLSESPLPSALRA